MIFIRLLFYRDRDRGRDRRGSRDRDRDRRDSRGRDRDRDRDRDRRDDRDNRRDRGNRWSDRDRSRDRRDNRDSRDLDSRDDRRDREKSLNDRLREMAGMGNYDDRDRNRERRDQALRFQPPDRIDDDFNRGPSRNEFSFQRGQPVDRPDFKEKDDITVEKKLDDEQNVNREDVPSDNQSKIQSTDSDTENTQTKLEGTQEMDQPEGEFSGPPGNDSIFYSNFHFSKCSDKYPLVYASLAILKKSFKNFFVHTMRL